MAFFDRTHVRNVGKTVMQNSREREREREKKQGTLLVGSVDAWFCD
jgi:hypothetical protein